MSIYECKNTHWHGEQAAHRIVTLLRANWWLQRQQCHVRVQGQVITLTLSHYSVRFFFFSRFIYLVRNNIAECTTLPLHESISKNCKMLTKKLWDIKTHKLFYPITKLYLWFRSQKQFTKHGTGCRSELNILGKEVYTGYPNSRLHVTTTWWQNLAVTPRSTKILAVRLTRSANKTKRFDAVILISE